MSGLLALLDDVAAIAKVAAASIDDIAAAAAKAGAKAAGVVIDDAAVTPKYVHGFEAKRELPIIWRISLGSLKNKLIILLPAALLLSSFAPQWITPLLMIGGAYLCFEGAEKVFHRLFPHSDATVDANLQETCRQYIRAPQQTRKLLWTAQCQGIDCRCPRCAVSFGGCQRTTCNQISDHL